MMYDEFGNPYTDEQYYMLQQQQMYNMQQQQEYNMNQMYQMQQQQMEYQQRRKITKKDIVEWLKGYYNTQNIVMVDEMETKNARHICPQGKVINIIPVVQQPVRVYESFVYVNIVYCRCCGKLIIDKNSLDML